MALCLDCLLLCGNAVCGSDAQLVLLSLRFVYGVLLAPASCSSSKGSLPKINGSDRPVCISGPKETPGCPLISFLFLGFF